MKKSLKILISLLFVSGIPILCSILTKSNKKRKKSELSVVSIFSKALKNNSKINENLNIKLYIPKGYNANREDGYPVLYLLHGCNKNNKDSEWDEFFPVLDKLINDGIIPPVIAVAPTGGVSFWVDSVKYGNYEKAVNEDLISYMDKTYNTEKTRSGRILIGFSMGGYGALRYSLVYPDKYSSAILLSPFVQDEEPPLTSGAVERGAFGEPFDINVWNDKNYPKALKTYSKQENRVRFYIFATDDDWNYLCEKEDLPKDSYKYNMEEQAVRLYTALHKQNLFKTDFEKGEDIPANEAELRIINGSHEIPCWLVGFENGLKYVFGKSESKQLSPENYNNP